MTTSLRCSPGLIAGLFLASHAYAQTPPDAGSLLRETEKNLRQPNLPATLPQVPTKGTRTDDEAGPQILVKGFRVTGLSLISEADVLAVLSPWVGQSVSFAGLRQAADAVAELYRSRGFLARAYLPEQDLTDGMVRIAVVEGRLGDLRVERINGADHLSETMARDYLLARNRMNEPVRPDDLQRAVTLLNELPGLNASSVLEPGDKEGESRVAVAIRNTPSVTGLIQGDNSGARSTGEYRLTGGLNLNSPLGIGDQVQVLGTVAEHTSYGRVAYSLPVGSDGLRVGASMSWLPYSYASNTTYSGNARVSGFNASYPVLRSNTRNLSVLFTYDRKAFQNSTGGNEFNNKRIDVGTLSLSGDNLDALAGGGLTQFSLGISNGHLDLSRNTNDLSSDQNSGGPDRNGSFNKINWTLARLQRLSAADTLAATASGQFADKNLDSAEKFLATGPYGVRAFSTSEPGGDSGLMLNVELRHQYSELFTALVFFDTARIERDKNRNTATPSPNAGNFSGAGFGANYGKASDLLIRASLAWRISDNPFRNPASGQDADGSLQKPRGWISLLKTF